MTGQINSQAFQALLACPLPSLKPLLKDPQSNRLILEVRHIPGKHTLSNLKHGVNIVGQN